MSKQSKPPSKPQAKPAGRQPIDPLLAQRLEQLNSRRPGSPLPPPVAAAAPSAGSASTRIPLQGTNAAQQQQLAAATARSQAARAGARSAGRRAKPARGAKAASLALSVVTTAGLAAMFANNESSTDSVILTGGTVAAADTTVAATAATTATTVVAAVGDTSTTAAGDTSTTAVATTPPANTTILDGTYVGAASQNRWGTVQVQAVYSGGQLVDVQILSYPDGDNKSVRINQRALPTLISEAITAQSADINGVSGATYTYNSYVASLQSAIDAAKSASGITG
ncbi:MAG: FMN-binding protein [Actinobacteria bacterium]|nr:FMN-binding protein [Actinomycetota bacterium]